MCIKELKCFSKKKDLYIATCDDEIAKYSNSISANCIMTSKKHKRASDRVYEAMIKIEKLKKTKYDLIVLLQGDEPLINPVMLKKAIDPFKKNKSIKVVNLMKRIRSAKEADDPNDVKVVFDKNKYALYFSRYAIPFNQTKKFWAAGDTYSKHDIAYLSGSDYVKSQSGWYYYTGENESTATNDNGPAGDDSLWTKK